mgnify:FL=1
MRLYVIRYECDMYGDHACDENALCDVKDITFTDKIDALHFMSECTSAIKNIFVVESVNDDSVPFNEELQGQIENDYVDGL